jgi:hypothetical protein
VRSYALPDLFAGKTQVWFREFLPDVAGRVMFV